MIEQYLIALMANNGFRYAAAITYMFGTVAWRIFKRAASCILLLCAMIIFIHWYFAIPYEAIFSEIGSVIHTATEFIGKAWKLFIEFAGYARSCIAR